MIAVDVELDAAAAPGRRRSLPPQALPKDKQTGATRYGAEIVAQTLDYQGANDEEAPVATPATEAPAPQPADLVAAAEPKRRRTKKAEVAAA